MYESYILIERGIIHLTICIGTTIFFFFFTFFWKSKQAEDWDGNEVAKEQRKEKI